MAHAYPMKVGATIAANETANRLNGQRYIHPSPQPASRRFDLIEAGSVS